MFSRNRLIIVTLVLLAYLPPALHHRKLGGGSTRRAFLLPVLPPASSALPSFKTELIAPAPLVPSAHVASLCELPDGTLCAAWYGGSHEGARDVNIYWSKRAQDPANSWSAPEVLVSRASAMRELRRPIKKLGNAVLFANGEAQLHLIYVTVSIGGWSTSSLNVKTSRDSGRTWLSSQRLTLSPFFNLSE